MSIQKLQLFLKDHNQDVMDFWVYRNRLVYLRTMNRNNGLLSFIKTWKFDLVMEQNNSMTNKIIQMSRVED